MTYIKLVVLLLQITQSVIRMMEQRKMIAEGERRVIAKQLAAVAAAAKIAQDVRKDVGSKTDEQIDNALRDDFRD